jgi:hypothetical protein
MESRESQSIRAEISVSFSRETRRERIGLMKSSERIRWTLHKIRITTLRRNSANQYHEIKYHAF